MNVQDELERAWKNAWSVEPTYPDDLEYIGMITKYGTMFMFYKDKSGGYWYKSKTEK